ncbi:unnamed protein product [Rhizophagus irregularis]|nr:unnamed protein product [Rhizophagus irregularis]
MVEEENFDEISEPERISLKFNELLENINDDTDNTSTFSDIDFEELEYLEEEIKEQEICDEMDEIIEHLEQQNFTPCNLGGHIYHHSGIRGKSATTCITEKLHDDDTKKGLEFIGNLLIKIAQTGNNEIKKNILIKTFEILLPLTSNEIYTDSTTTIPIPTTNTSINYEQEKIIFNKPPSLFMIKLLFIKIFKEKEIKKDEIRIWTCIWAKTMELTFKY